ncbi:hypothetical protein SAMN05216325_11123 [Nitrosomonas marina]|uniref:Uncharacterized protein n=2 Tax=Nitrosomonas marina TaxID=917 RepID=A0A1H8EYS6_9PROT|nr:hypothetical protein SAMN05216325_11123 [Nitrosomonas marina]
MVVFAVNAMYSFRNISSSNCIRHIASLAGLIILTGCLSPITLNKTVLAYNRSISEINAQELLLNIARVRHHHPIQFTTVSSIAATFNFQMSAGATPPFGALTSGQGLSPIFGGSISENPTISITPISGEEFNQRILNPFSENKFLKLYQQGTDLGLLIRMMASEIRIKHDGIDQVLRNRPREQDSYEEFRRKIMHLTALNQANQLQVEPVIVQQDVTMHGITTEHSETLVNALEMGYRWIEKGNTGVLSRKVSGRTIISNYDISSLSVEERNKLFLYTNTLPENEIFVDIRPGLPGGDYPIQGIIRLRAFLAILGFLGRGVSEEIEFHVDKDSRTGEIRHDPIKTLEVDIRSSNLVDNTSTFAVAYKGRTYSILDGDSPEAVWNLEAFRLLGQLYELSIHPSEFARPAPAITIAK